MSDQLEKNIIDFLFNDLKEMPEPTLDMPRLKGRNGEYLDIEAMKDLIVEKVRKLRQIVVSDYNDEIQYQEHLDELFLMDQELERLENI